MAESNLSFSVSKQVGETLDLPLTGHAQNHETYTEGEKLFLLRKTPRDYCLYNLVCQTGKRLFQCHDLYNDIKFPLV